MGDGVDKMPLTAAQYLERAFTIEELHKEGRIDDKDMFEAVSELKARVSEGEWQQAMKYLRRKRGTSGDYGHKSE